MTTTTLLDIKIDRHLIRSAVKIAREIRRDGIYSHLALQELDAFGNRLRRNNPGGFAREHFFHSAAESHAALRLVQEIIFRRLQRHPDATPFATRRFLVGAAVLARRAGQRETGILLLTAAGAARRRQEESACRPAKAA